MVAQDPKMQDLIKDEKATYMAALSQHCEQKLDDLHIHTGTYGTLFVIRGHINDTIQSTMHGTDNSKDFWGDVYDSPMASFLQQYEQWACTQNQNLNERDSLETVHKQAQKLIVRGLVAMTGKRDITMNYNNYKTVIIETYAVKLVEWPQGVKFTSPSNIRTVGKIRKLRNALKDQTCYCQWAALTPAEVKVHSTELDACHSAAMQEAHQCWNSLQVQGSTYHRTGKQREQKAIKEGKKEY
ncbi:hypothetical protein F4604DRAFT_1919445 [Suillus subluteus]|nr:hypothetical protein F4604DRAFT_1919445 [Suillus subluteus]